MIKKTFNSILGAAALSFAAHSFAGEIVVMDPNSAVLQTKFAISKFDEFKKTDEFQEIKLELESVTADLKASEELAKKEGMTWSEAKQNEHTKKVRSMLEDREFAIKKLQNQEKEISQVVFQTMGDQVKVILEKIVKDGDIDMVLKPESVIYVDRESNRDITGKITAELDKVFK